MTIRDGGPTPRREKENRPPRLPWWILRSLSHYDHEFSLTGDCGEEYEQIARRQGRRGALFWIWGQALGAAAQAMKRSAAFGGTMIRNYLKITLRNLKRHKALSWITIAGLGTGLAISFFILLWVQDELSYDGFHEHSDAIFRVYELWETSAGALNPIASSPYPLGPALEANYPEVEESLRLFSQDKCLVRHGEKRFYEDGFVFADAGFFTFFSFPLLQGNPGTVLKEPDSLVISRSMAEKYFGHEDPIGKILRVNTRHDLIITGVMRDMPHNSHLRAGLVGNLAYLISIDWSKRWVDHSYYTYLRLRKDTDQTEFGTKIRTYINDNQHDPTTIHLALQPLKDIHLRSHFDSDIGGPSQGKALYVTMFTLVAVMVLLIACINHMTLATAKAADRAKEIGIRKVSGASKRHLVKQFMGESIFLSAISFLFSLVCVAGLLPRFNMLTGKNFSIGSAFEGSMLLCYLSITLVTGLLAGSYPAFYLASFRPSTVLKKEIHSGARSRAFRRALVVVQFGFAVILLVGTLVIHSQLTYMQGKNLGLNKDNIVYIRLRGKLAEDHTAFKDELTRIPEIQNVTTASSLPLHISWGTTGVDWEGRNPGERIHWSVMSVDFEFIDTFGLELAAGRAFSREFATDTEAAYIINQAGAEALGFDHAVGKKFNVWDAEGSIIGVVRDFHVSSLHDKIGPLVIKVHPDWDAYVFLRIGAEQTKDVMTRVAGIHKNLNPDYPFTFRFLDEAYDGLYRSEERTETLFRFFSLVAIFISCLGLFGLSSFTAGQRTKEIGIRKVFGARVSGILLQLLRDLTRWVLVANLAAWPIAYFAMRQWLNNFAYRTGMDVRIFFFSGLATMLIAAVTVGFKSIKAATANPIDSLRYE